MDNFKKYLLISDLDGTLINSRQEISVKNQEAVKHFIQNGGIFAVATGRTTQNIRLHIKELPINGPCILYNGSAIYDFSKENIINIEYLENHLIVEYIEYCMNRFSSMVVEIFTPDMMFIVTPEENVDPYVFSENQVFQRSNLEQIMNMQWIKVMFSDTHANLLEAEKAMKAFGLTDKIDSVFSHEHYLEFLKKDVSKGTALKYIKLMEEYRTRIVVAVGDFDNDLEMIKTADLGIAVDNARDCLKHAADKVVVSNDQDAIYHIIHNIIPEIDK